jgi:hypothetical protein
MAVTTKEILRRFGLAGRHLGVGEQPMLLQPVVLLLLSLLDFLGWRLMS